MEVYVGTSGWAYPWNEGGNFSWYIEHSGLNAVELNSSFYRFPFQSMIKFWAAKTGNLRWSVKVTRLVTHTYKFAGGAMAAWHDFRQLFTPLEGNIDFYLFQLPPSLTPESSATIEAFFQQAALKERFALEPRNVKWFDDKWFKWASKLGLTWVSVDSPVLPRNILVTNSIVYVRMHGRTAWYSYKYTLEELKNVAHEILNLKPRKAYVFFNNDEDMLVNSREMFDILRKAA